MSRIGKGQVFSTAGAIPVKNEKGQIAMEKVKVHRYVAGKRPDFAEGDSSSDSESSGDDNREREGGTFVKPQLPLSKHAGDREVKREIDDGPSQDVIPKMDVNDARLRRLQNRTSRDEDEARDRHGRRLVEEPQIIKRSRSRRSSSSASSSSDEDDRRQASPGTSRHRRPPASDDDDDEMSDEELERRRQLLRLKAKEREREEELLVQQEESDQESGVEDEESEYEEYSESEDETAPRLKPVFVRKRDRLTLQETEKEQQRLNDLQLEQKKMKEEKKRQTVKLVEELVKQEIEMEKKKDDDERFDLAAVNTDDENEELSYEAWKLRELKRIKRDKEEREQREREKAELDRIHSMTEEERRAYLRANPKIVTNKAHKGKYKFLQKYFHRGVFYLDQEDEVFKRNFAEPTLEDQFDKAVLPKVMQVKDFGKAGRTKWTHLVAEDTTDFQSAWNADTQQNIKFHQKHAAGVKDVFEKPSAAKKRRKV